MSTVIEHVRHRVPAYGQDERGNWLAATLCGKIFAPGGSGGYPMECRGVPTPHPHEPETSRCPKCYP